MLNIHYDQIEKLKAHGESTYPEECCGLLLGKINGESKTLIEVLPTENSWDKQTADQFMTINGLQSRSSSKSSSFLIAPRLILKAQKYARDRQIDIIGVYHSHPDHQAIPSEFDRAIAWQRYSYIIISVQKGKACELKSWRLDDNHQFQPEEMLMV
ncbi:MAG: M67 family metallopeptidase [Symploca sp. SIO2E9]|nr:M67 family metallopeptidase [Symploca sp. SIO2E9]